MTQARLQFDLVPDKKGVVWDLMLYIPTVVALGSISASLWYGDDHNTSYLLFFLTCFFFIAGFNRVMTRMILLPSSPVNLILDGESLITTQKGGAQTVLIKNQKFFSDYAGKSFAMSGIDGTGKSQQFVFHRGQFSSSEQFELAQTELKTRFKK